MQISRLLPPLLLSTALNSGKVNDTATLPNRSHESTTKNQIIGELQCFPNSFFAERRSKHALQTCPLRDFIQTPVFRHKVSFVVLLSEHPRPATRLPCCSQQGTSHRTLSRHLFPWSFLRSRRSGWSSCHLVIGRVVDDDPMQIPGFLPVHWKLAICEQFAY